MLIRLHDSHEGLAGRRDRWRQMTRLGLIHCMADDGDAGGDAGAGGGGSDEDAPGGDTADDDAGVTGDKVIDPAQHQKVLDDRAHKGNQNVALKKDKDELTKEAAELRGKLKKYEDADKSDLEKVQAELTEATTKLTDVTKKLDDSDKVTAQLKREQAATEAGIKAKYKHIGAADFKTAAIKAVEKNIDLDPTEFWAQHQKDNPELYGNGAAPLDTGGGGAGPDGGAPNKDAQVKQAEAELAEALANGTLTAQREAVLLSRIEVLKTGVTST